MLIKNVNNTNNNPIALWLNSKRFIQNLWSFFYRVQNLLAPATSPPSDNNIFSDPVPSESPSTYNDASNNKALNFYESKNQLSYHYDEPLNRMKDYSEVEFSSHESMNMMAKPYIVNSNINSDP